MKKLTNLFVVIVSMLSLSGCGKDSLLDRVHDILDKYEEKYDSINEFTYVEGNVVSFDNKENSTYKTLAYNGNNNEIYYLEEASYGYKSELYYYVTDGDLTLVNNSKKTYYEYEYSESTSSTWISLVEEVYSCLDSLYALELTVLYFVESTIKSNLSYDDDVIDIYSTERGYLTLEMKDYEYDGSNINITISIEDYILKRISMSYDSYNTINEYIISLEDKIDFKVPDLEGYEKLKDYA